MYVVYPPHPTVTVAVPDTLLLLPLRGVRQVRPRELLERRAPPRGPRVGRAHELEREPLVRVRVRVRVRLRLGLGLGFGLG